MACLSEGEDVAPGLSRQHTDCGEYLAFSAAVLGPVVCSFKAQNRTAFIQFKHVWPPWDGNSRAIESRQGPRTTCPAWRIIHLLTGYVGDEHHILATACRFPQAAPTPTLLTRVGLALFADDAGIAARLAKKLIGWNAPNADKLQVRC
jgi:hypothetical protein